MRGGSPLTLFWRHSGSLATTDFFNDIRAKRMNRQFPSVSSHFQLLHRDYSAPLRNNSRYPPSISQRPRRIRYRT
ncbi:protein of unknown function [Azospirillum lipoferum 4B]|uniref:Uncharacterized protein n=1 Tax=Azospirillum lipoferum (strain 4B) TaxID=862719 RepID=G7Z8C9_AZOL4|nr:protein of unknown function [Azospirillum lipoferum 4B]